MSFEDLDWLGYFSEGLIMERKVLCDKCRKEAKDAAGK